MYTIEKKNRELMRAEYNNCRENVIFQYNQYQKIYIANISITSSEKNELELIKMWLKYYIHYTFYY